MAHIVRRFSVSLKGAEPQKTTSSVQETLDVFVAQEQRFYKLVIRPKGLRSTYSAHDT